MRKEKYAQEQVLRAGVRYTESTFNYSWALSLHEP